MNALKLLAIDTSGKVASAAVMADGLLLAEKSVYTKLTHSQIILPMAKQLLSDCGLDFSELDGVVCAKGPGSYTGLRIGAAAVKGMVMGCPSLKCAGISTLEALAWNCAAFRGNIAAVMRARNKIVYCAVYRSDGVRMICVQPDRVCGEEEFVSLISGETVLVGDCCEEMKRTYFADNDEIKCAPPADRLQKASSLCMAYEVNPETAVSADALNVSYLQETKAEKDKAHRDN
ncbi:MAG: tRNA (adenosine(37)-N6)-threonylcarbamoyltransferase complex dimerization subunit type 1 TsaB [Oscillospiraceae bacterium]